MKSATDQLQTRAGIPFPQGKWAEIINAELSQLKKMPLFLREKILDKKIQSDAYQAYPKYIQAWIAGEFIAAIPEEKRLDSFSKIVASPAYAGWTPKQRVFFTKYSTGFLTGKEILWDQVGKNSVVVVAPKETLADRSIFLEFNSKAFSYSDQYQKNLDEKGLLNYYKNTESKLLPITETCRQISASYASSPLARIANNAFTTLLKGMHDAEAEENPKWVVSKKSLEQKSTIIILEPHRNNVG